MAAIYGCTNMGVYEPYVNMGVWQGCVTDKKLCGKFSNQTELTASLDLRTELQGEVETKCPAVV